MSHKPAVYLFALLSCVASASGAFASFSELAEYKVCQLVGTESTVSNFLTTTPNWTVSPMSIVGATPGVGAAGQFLASNWTGPSSYLKLTIAADPGYRLSLDAITFQDISTSAATTVDVGYILDGGALTSLGSYSSSTAETLRSFSPPASLEGSTIEIRLSATTPTGATKWGLMDPTCANPFIVYGSAASVPEPTALGLLSLVGLPALMLRRKPAPSTL
jgi:hypothetical protein